MILLRRALERGGDHGVRCPQQGGEEVMEIEMALTGGADDAGEHLLRLRASGRPIAPTDLAVDHDGADRVLGAPVECRAYCYAELSTRGR